MLLASSRSLRILCWGMLARLEKVLELTPAAEPIPLTVLFWPVCALNIAVTYLEIIFKKRYFNYQLSGFLGFGEI